MPLPWTLDSALERRSTPYMATILLNPAADGGCAAGRAFGPACDILVTP